MECSSIPLHIINLECDLINKIKVTVGVVSSLPCEGISLLLGNDLAGGKVVPDVITSDTPSKLINNDVCNVVTRSSHKVLRDVEVPDNSHDLENTFMNTTDEDIINIQHLSCNKAKIIIDQQSDETLKQCYNDLVPFEELDDHGICYYLKDGLLMRKYRPSDKKSLMRFLGTIGYDRRFCVNFSSLINPLTNLLGKNVKFIWSKECNEAFERVKRLLMTSPVLITANYEKQFSLYVDASDVGVGAVLTQSQQWGPDLPFFGHAGHADPLDGWRCCSQKRVMSRPIQVRQL